MHNMGQVQHQLGNFQEAIKLYDEALRIVKKEFGERHYKVFASVTECLASNI